MNSKSVTGTRHPNLGLRVAITAFAGLATAMFIYMTGDLKKQYPSVEWCFHDREIQSPVLATELSHQGKYLQEVFQGSTNPGQSLKDADDEEVKKAATKPGASKDEIDRWKQAEAVHALWTNTVQDCFFIPLYAGALISLALLFTAESRRPRLRWFAVGVAVLAAALDYWEDVGIFTATKAHQIDDKLAWWISTPSYIKWSSLGITLLLLAATIWFSQISGFRKGARWVLSIAFLLAGILLLVSTLHLPLFPVANGAFALAILISAVGLPGPFFESPKRGSAVNP